MEGIVGQSSTKEEMPKAHTGAVEGSAWLQLGSEMGHSLPKLTRQPGALLSLPRSMNHPILSVGTWWSLPWTELCLSKGTKLKP